MKNTKKIVFVAIALAIVGLLITSAASLPIKEIKSIELTSKENDEITAHYAAVQCQPLSKVTLGTSKQPLLLAGVPITGGDYDEYHGSAAGAPGGGFYAMAEYSEDGMIWHPVLYGSGDGTTWDPLVEFLYDNSEYTDMDQNDHGTYGTFGAPPDSDGLIVVVQGEIQDGWVWDFGDDNINEFNYNCIACYTFEGPDGDPGTWNWGGLTLTGYNGWGTNDIEGCPFIFYQSSELGSGIIGWLTGNVAGCTHVGSAMDLATNIHYAVYDRNTGDNYELLVRKDDFGSWKYNPTGDYWTHNYLTSKHISSTANLMYPSVAAYDDNVIVACQKDDDVIVYYSTNGFSTYGEVLVQDSASYPEVEMAGGGIAVITYIKDGVLYYRTSDTGGASWSAADVVSDNQVNLNNRAANLDQYTGNIYGAWEDTRGANIDIYFDLVYEFANDPPYAPTITGPAKAQKDEPTDYTFAATDPNGHDVRYHINWGDGDSETTVFNPSGTPVILSHTWTEKETYTITAKAEDEYGLEGPEGTLAVKVPVFEYNQLVLKTLGKTTIGTQILARILGL